MTDWKFALLDAGVLSVIVATIAYFAFVRPKARQVRAASTAESRDLARFSMR